MWSFILFVLATIGAAVFSRHKWVRAGYVSFLLTFILYCGLLGRAHYPFVSWHLFGYLAEPSIEFYEVRVFDAEGDEVKYDARAVRPALITPIRRLALQMRNMPDQQFQDLSRFLVERGRDYLERPRVLDMWRFPPHQIGIRWDKELVDPPVGLRVYRRQILFSEDGRELVASTDTLLRSANVY